MRPALKTSSTWIAAGVLLVSLAGCYRLSPVDSTTSLSGVDVSLALTDEGSVRMAPLIGPRIAAVEGRVITPADTAIELAVRAVVAQGGRTMNWSQERLAVPRSAVASVRTRTLDRKRTWFVAGLTIVGAFALGEAFGLGTGLDGLLGIDGGGGKK
jgi:hypothetical protein